VTSVERCSQSAMPPDQYITRSIEAALELEVKLAIAAISRLHGCAYETAAKHLLAQMRRERESRAVSLTSEQEVAK